MMKATCQQSWCHNTQIPSVAEHSISATADGRPIRVAPVIIQPGETAPAPLPYNGLTASEYLRMTLAGEECRRNNINRTRGSITIYHGIWADTGNNAGYFWEKHLVFTEPKESNLEGER